MREITFRGKRADNGEWVCSGNIIRCKYDNENEICYIPALGSYLEITEDKNGNITQIKKGMFYKVVPETIGQYTGLTDKNGTKIFEGDIVKREYTLWHGETKKTRETQIGVVVYSNRDCGFQVEKKCNLRKPWDGDTIEVIGNIHDNPELLKGE